MFVYNDSEDRLVATYSKKPKRHAWGEVLDYFWKGGGLVGGSLEAFLVGIWGLPKRILFGYPKSSSKKLGPLEGLGMDTQSLRSPLLG